MPFSEATLDFLSKLEANNERDWFQPRKQDYEELVRSPMLEMVDAINKDLARAGPDYVTDPPKAVYRVYRDTRFSKDKTPYKTHIGALFPHRLLGKNGGAALYVHLSPQEFLVAGGLYHCPAPLLAPVRAHIAEHYEKLTAILKSRAIRQNLGELQGDELTRPPKGYRADHPAVSYLRRRDLLLETAMAPEKGLGREGARAAAKRFTAMVPFIQFINEPLLRNRKQSMRDPLLHF